jgi:hypothetical protein
MKKGWELKKGVLRTEDGTVLSSGISRPQAKLQFPEYRIVFPTKKRDALDYRLPGSYGSRQ